MIALMMLPILFLGKHLYQWWAFPNAASTWNAYKAGIMSQEQMLTTNSKHTMLSPSGGMGAVPAGDGLHVLRYLAA